jgi:hypothetical protein
MIILIPTFYIKKNKQTKFVYLVQMQAVLKLI